MKYTDDLYAETGLSPEVKKYIRYNANKALMNLSIDTMFSEEEVNPIVTNGISNTGSTYAIAKVAPITDDTFKF